MSINVDMRVRTSFGPLDLGMVTQETTVGTILTKAQEIILSQYPTSREASSLREGKQLQLIAYNDSLSRDLKIEELIRSGRITSGENDNFFYKCQLVVERKM